MKGSNKLLKGLHRQNLDNEFLMLLEPVDGTHIPIQRPRTQFHQRYINREGYHSIALMAIVDDTESFILINLEVCTKLVLSNSQISGKRLWR